MACLKQLLLELNGQLAWDADSIDDDNPLVLELKKAKLEWDNACNYFNQIIDADLIDYAIFEMEAAERKYIHLLKIIKQEIEEEKLLVREKEAGETTGREKGGEKHE